MASKCPSPKLGAAAWEASVEVVVVAPALEVVTAAVGRLLMGFVAVLSALYRVLLPP